MITNHFGGLGLEIAGIQNVKFVSTSIIAVDFYNLEVKPKIFTIIFPTSIVYYEESLSRRISTLFTNFLNIAVGNVLINKSVKLSLDRICFTSISPLL
jgi:hypothetical protein